MPSAKPGHANSVEGFNLRMQRTVAGVFHHISPQHADLYFHEIGFRWSQRIAEGEVVRRNRHGREKSAASDPTSTEPSTSWGDAIKLAG
jgi:hypothetical protein